MPSNEAVEGAHRRRPVASGDGVMAAGGGAGLKRGTRGSFYQPESFT
jgi:hypothetical protein